MVIDERNRRYLIQINEREHGGVLSFLNAKSEAEKLAPDSNQRINIFIEDGNKHVLCAWRENGLWEYVEELLEQSNDIP